MSIKANNGWIFSDLGFPLTEKVYFAVKTCEDL